MYSILWGWGGGVWGLRWVGGVRVFNQLDLTWEMILSYPGGADYSYKGPNP